MDPASIRYASYEAEGFYERRGTLVGGGRVGGKAKGLAFASEALDGSALRESVLDPERTLVFGTDVFDSYITGRGLSSLYDEEDPAAVERAIAASPLSDDIMSLVERAIDSFDEIGAPPLAVRSSSLLEDSVSLAFAGKYYTRFAPNVGSRASRAADLASCIKAVWASLFDQSARAYREKHGRAHRDEKMAVIVQSLSGREHGGGLYYPELAGTIFSRVYRRPNPRIKKEDGLIRLCFGLGTRTVDRCAARTFYLTNPSLRPEGNLPAQIAASSQEYFDCIDRGTGEFITEPLLKHCDMIRREHKSFGAFVEFYSDGALYSVLSEPDGPSRPMFSFPELHLREKPLFETARRLMSLMEEEAGLPMDMEFTYESKPTQTFRLVQMRPLTAFAEMARIEVPDVPAERVVFRGDRMVANGSVRGATHLVYVDPYSYKSDWSPAEVARAVGEINRHLAGEKYILAGPGRWGSRNPALGVPIVYAEICNASCLVEISVPELNFSPELSFGTHFFLDMDADGIHYLPVFSGQKGNAYNRDLLESLPHTTGMHPAVRVYEGSFSAYLDGETESGAIVTDER